MTMPAETKSCCEKQPSTNRVKPKTYVPKFDSWSSGEKIILQGDLPGVDPAQIEIEYDDGTLTLRGSVNERFPHRGGLRQEYGVGNFERKFNLGDGIDADAISAKFSGGVLTLHLPFVAKVKPRKIEVKQE